VGGSRWPCRLGYNLLRRELPSSVQHLSKKYSEIFHAGTSNPVY
jgi:hypothetical protein